MNQVSSNETTRPRIWAIAGTKGGVGKSTLVANLALYLSTIGRKVVAVDIDSVSANLAVILGADSENMLATFEHEHLLAPGKAFPVESSVLRRTPFQDLYILDASLEEPMGGLEEPMGEVARNARRRRTVEALSSLEVSDIILDLGSGSDTALLDAYLSADTAVFLFSPEPGAIHSTYQFVKHVFQRKVLHRLESSADQVRWLRLIHKFGHQSSPLAMCSELERQGDAFAGLARTTLKELQLRCVLSLVRTREDRDLALDLRSAAYYALGTTIEPVGLIEFDDSVFSCVRKKRPLLLEVPGARASKHIEKIARRMLALDTGKTLPMQFADVPRTSHYGLLEVSRAASDEEVRRAYKRMRDIYQLDSLVCQGLYNEDEIASLRSRLEEAHDILLDPSRRRLYELSVFPNMKASIPPRSSEPKRVSLGPAPDISLDTEFDGHLLRAVRESQGIELREIGDRTKINTSFLEAIEDEDWKALPAKTYVRGFVIEFAKMLGLDASQVSRTYMRRFNGHP